MNRFQQLYTSDLERYEKIPVWNRLYHYYLRKTQTSGNPLLKTWYHLCFRLIGDLHRMEISYGAKIGKGLFLADPFTVTINSNAVLGENVSLGKNVTIGKQNRGERAGSPVIGDGAVIGDNAVIAGRITIGNHVTIAANAYVNRDVPDNMDISGNPAVMREKNDQL